MSSITQTRKWSSFCSQKFTLFIVSRNNQHTSRVSEHIPRQVGSKIQFELSYFLRERVEEKRKWMVRMNYRISHSLLLLLESHSIRVRLVTIKLQYTEPNFCSRIQFDRFYSYSSPLCFRLRGYISRTFRHRIIENYQCVEEEGNARHASSGGYANA